MEVDASQSTSGCFGGSGDTTLFITTARQGLREPKALTEASSQLTSAYAVWLRLASQVPSPLDRGGEQGAPPDSADFKPLALITGALQGIGAAVSRRLAQDGMSVPVAYRPDPRRGEQAEGVAFEIANRGGRAIAVPGDVADPKSVEEMYRLVEGELGPVTGLDCNAARSAPAALQGLPQRGSPADVPALSRSWPAPMPRSVTGQVFTVDGGWIHY